jgi:diaminopimelate epimerase
VGGDNRRFNSSPQMKLSFSKMQGAGNDFVVLDATRQPLALTASQVRHLADRRFGVGADQVLVVEKASSPEVDFRYRIFNNTGGEVEHCGNGARCFLRFVQDKGLTDKRSVRVQTVNRVLELHQQADGRVMVDMGAPDFEPSHVPFDPSGLHARREGLMDFWPVAPECELGVVSMGNPHAVQRVGDVETAAVAQLGPPIENHTRFAHQVNAGFMQVLSRQSIKLRVYERGAGETLACGTGACAAVVVGIRAGWLGPRVDVQTHGGLLTIEWAGEQSSVKMTGPAEFVFDGEITL